MAAAYNVRSSITELLKCIRRRVLIETYWQTASLGQIENVRVWVSLVHSHASYPGDGKTVHCLYNYKTKESYFDYVCVLVFVMIFFGMRCSEFDTGRSPVLKVFRIRVIVMLILNLGVSKMNDSKNAVFFFQRAY